MDLTNVDNLKVALQLAGLRASKGLGQHFLVDRESLDAVMDAGAVSSHDTVVEVGPGLGVMTIPLTTRAQRVIAVEMDTALAELLERDHPQNLEVVSGDILQFDMRSLPEQYKVVANVPYYITSAIIRLFLEAERKPSVLALLIQKEVAERITADAGKMSVLAFSVQYYGAPEITRIVERHKFWPAPKVDSAILKVAVYDEPAFPADRDKLFRLVKAGFGEKRKQLKNSLAGGLNIGMELALRIIAEAKLPETVRAQELSLKEWQRLYERFMHYEVL